MTSVYAHRGYSGDYPENTLLAFSKAIDWGAAGIELDVHVSSDRVPVVIHDRDLARTTTGIGNVDETPLRTLQTLDAGSGQSIPRLTDVLALAGNQLHLDIEVKGRGIEAEVLSVLSRHPGARWAISSFDWDTLRRFRALDETAELWPLAETAGAPLLAVSAELGSPAVALYHASYSQESARALRQAGLHAMVWTVNDPAEARRVSDLGAFALCTDDPARVAQALTDGRPPASP